MSLNSHIEWTQATWNPVTGCTKVSPGCKHCYAERMAKRLHAMGQHRYRNKFELTIQPEALNEPRKWKRSKVVFVNSMSDLFHPDVPLSYIRRVFKVMRECPQHQFQILTKRSERLREVAPLLKWSDNMWIGVSVENQKYTNRIADLRTVRQAGVRFLSIEPLIGPIDRLDLRNIDWVIVGGESGPGSRPMFENWVKAIKDKCEYRRVPFFFKQWGGVNKKRAGRTLLGQTWDAMPVAPQADNSVLQLSVLN